MVAVVSGNGLGVDTSSLRQLGQGLGGQAAIGQGSAAQYVNTATGNLVLESQDEGLIFDGLSLDVLRTYNSQGQLSGSAGWQFGFSRSIGGLTGTLDTAGSTITRTDDDGSAVIYTYNATLGKYVSTGQSGAQDTLSWSTSASTWTWTDVASRQQETYNASGQLTVLSDAETGASYSFSYASGRLSQILAGDGDALTFAYNASGQLTGLSIKEIPPGQTTAVTRQQVSYTYDTQGRLSTVATLLTSDTDSSSASYTTTYTYSGTSDRVASVTQSDGTTVSYTYTEDAQGVYQVTGITTGTGAAAQSLTLSYGSNSTTITNALGQATTYTYNAAGELTQVAAPTVNGSSPTTSYTYDANGNLLTATDADGAVTRYSYDANGNLLSVEDATGHTVSYTYNADDQMLSQTLYAVAAQGVVGQTGYVAPSGAQTTYYVYDASDRLNYVVDPLGNVTEHDYTTTSGLTVLSSTKQYVGVGYSLTGLSPSTPPSLATLQSWVASSPVQATLGRLMRTDYTYDVRGQLATQTQWDTVNSSGVGVLDVGTTITTTTYDGDGQLLQTATERGASRTTLETTSYAYDSLGRLITRTDPLGHVTTYLYTDSSNTLAITQANGLTTTQVRNSAGLLISSTQSASGQSSRVTSYLYNAAGEPVAQIDAAGNVSYTFYDADGRVTGTVDATGAVTAYTYDADGHVIGTTQYATLISTSGWVSGGALTASLPSSLPVPTGTASDTTTHTLVDAAGRVIATIDAEGNVTTTTYDGEGNALSNTAYATALTSAQLTALGSAPTWAALQADLTASASNRTTYTLYDADGHAAATIDAAGFVTVTTYDTAGRAIKTTASATALTSAQLAALGSTPALSALQADLATGAGEQTTRTYYDGEGNAVAQVDADGYLTTTAYDETTHTTTTTRYATALTSTQLTALTGSESVATLVGLLGSTPASEVSTTTYNADGQVTSATAVDGTVTAYSYNTVGQLLSTTVTPTAGQGTARTTSATYDAFGDTLTSVDGNQATTTYTYNVLGQRLTATDALGNTTWYVYDADGRVNWVVTGIADSTGHANALGDFKKITYNAFGQVQKTVSYATSLSLSSLNLATATPAQVGQAVSAVANPAIDDAQIYQYTLDGQVANVSDGLGYAKAYAYDAFGDVIQQQQQLSQPGLALSAANSTISTFAYDNRGEQTGETDGVGSAVARSTASTYDAFGRLTSSTDGNGNVVTYSYDNLGRRIGTSQTVGGVARTTHTTYDAFDRTVTQTDALGNVTSYQYDVANHKVIVTTPDGVTMTTVTDAFGDTVSVTDGAGDTTTYTYDGDGRLLTTKDALGNVSTDQYDLDGDLIQTTDATGHIVTYTYDANGRVLSQTVDPTGLALVTTYSYDGDGRELSVTDPTGTVTTYAYDADGHTLTQVQDAGSGKLNLTTTSTYDGAGKTLTVTVGAGTSAARTTQYVYDNLERLSQQIVDPGTGHLNLTTSYAYDGNNNLIRVTDANGHVTRSVYDAANALVYAINAAGAVTQTGYDADGRITVVRAYATALTAAQLTALGGTPSVAAVAADLVTSASDTVSYTAYNAEGQVRYSVDPMGYVTETRYDAAGRVSETLAYAHAVSVTASEATVLQSSSSTALSSLASLVSGAGNTDANAEATLHLYDADGQTRFLVQQNTVGGQLVGQVTEQRYDAAGRIIASVAYGSTLSLSTGSALTAQLTTSSVAQALASAPKQITQSVYDNAGRLRYTIDTTNHVTETQVDKDGRVTAQLAYANAITLPGTLTVATVGAAVTTAGTTGARTNTTTYDDVGRVLTTGDALGVNATYTYDATGLALTRKDRDGYITTTTYDLAGRQTVVQSPAVTVGSYSGTTLQTSTQYLYTTTTYDSVGNVTSISQGSGPSASAITTLSTTSYAYDAVNHQTTTTYTGGTVTTVVTYNALGQAVVDKDADGHYQYDVYNADGELAYAVDADGYVTGTTYDAYGNVLTTTRYATALKTSAITGWSAGQPLTLAQLALGLVTSASDRTITTTYNQRNQKTQVMQSSISSVLVMGANSGNVITGAPTTTYTYDAYGNVTSASTLVQEAFTAGSTTTPAVWATTYNYYDALNRLVMTVTPTGAYTSPAGYVTTTTYDGLGDVLSTTQYATAIATSSITTATPPALPATSATDRITTYGYDAIGRKTSETDTGEYSDVNGTSGIATGSSVTTITYDGENRVKTLTVNGMTTTTAYDAAGRVISVTAPARLALVSNWQSILQSTPGDDLATAALYASVSPVTTYIYDALGHALSTTVAGTGATSQQTLATYNALGQQVKSVDANGNVTTSTYDNNGNMLTQSYTLTGNSGSSTVTSTYTYDADNQQLTSITQRSGQSGYDSYTQVKYNAFGEVIAKGDNNGYEATYTYDNNGNLLTAPDAKTGAVHTYYYSLTGWKQTDASTVTGGGSVASTTNIFDLSGRVIWQRQPSDISATGANSGYDTFTYDRWGNVLSSTDAAGNTTQYLYDSQNQLIREIEPNVLVVSATGVRTWQTPTKNWYYNVSGQLVGVTDEDGNTSLNTYDAAGNLIIAQDATGAKTYTAYDALGRAVAQETPPANTLSGPLTHITYTTYDNLNQVTSQGDFLLTSAGTARTQQAQETYVLNSHGDRIQVTDALGNTSYYSYDSQHRVLSSQTPIQHASGWSETFTYDANGNQTGETTADGDHESWVYDYFGRVTSHVDLSGATTTYTYDASSGLLTSETSNWTPAGQTNPGYLPGLLTGTTSTEQYQYEADGQVAKVTQITGSTTAEWDTYQYDANGNQTVDATYTTDGAGLVVHTETVSSYDSHNRLSVETTENPDNSVANSRLAYNYDAAGNRRAVFAQSAYGTNASPISGNGGPPTGTVSAQTAQPGQAWNFSAASSFTDNVGFGLTFTATQSNGSALPSWMTFNNSNGTFGGTPTTNGSWTVTVTATDVNGQSVSSTFTVTVPVAAPVFTAGASNQTGSVHGALNFTVPGATDANGSALTYTASLSTGAALPSWLSFNATTRAFTGTPPVGSIGSYALKVTATAANGGSAASSFTLTVAPTAPVYTTGVGNQTTYGGRAFSFAYSASDFTEADGDALTFTAGSYSMSGSVETDSALPSWMSFNASTLTFTGTPPTTAVGQSFTLYLTGTNPQGQTAEAHFTVAVAQYVQPAPVYNGTLTNQTGVIGGASLNIGLPANAFVEPDGGALTYTAMVLVPDHQLEYPVDGGTDSSSRDVPAAWEAISAVGLSINATTGAITGVPTTLSYQISQVGGGENQYDSAYQIEIIATNAQSGTVSGTFELTNSFAPPAVIGSIPAQTITPNGSVQSYSIPAVFSDTYGHGLTYTSNAPAWAGFSNGTFVFSATTEPAGTYTWTITATDGLGHTASTTISVTVNNVAPFFPTAAPNVTAVAGQPFSCQVSPAQDYNGDSLGYSADMWNGSAYVALPSWVTFNSSTLTFSGTPPSTGSFTLVCWVGDTHGALGAEGFTLTVNAPVSGPPVYHGTVPSEVYFYYGSANSWSPPAGAFTNPTGRALTYSLSGAYPTTVTFNSTTGTLSTATLANITHDHDYGTMVLTATDPVDGQSVSASFDLYFVGTGGTGTQVVKAGPTTAATTQVATPQTTQATTPNIQADWFTYDADNRVLVNDGSLVNSQIVLTPATYENTTYANQYDAAGNVAVLVTDNAGVTMSQSMEYDQRNELVETDYALSAGQASLGAQQRQAYDADGHLLSTYQYLNNQASESVYGTIDVPDGYVTLSTAGWVSAGETSTYNADGVVTAQVSLVNPDTNWVQVVNKIQQGGAAPVGTDPSRLALGSTTTYTAFDHADNVTAYSYAQSPPQGTTTGGFGANYTVSYIKKDGYLQQSTTGTPTVSGYVPATDTVYYDAFGRTLAVAQTSEDNSGATQNITRAYAYNTAGEILEERSGTISGTTLTPTNGYFANHYTYVNGQQVSDMDEEGEIGVGTTLTGFSTSTQGYVIQVGDTLASIAQTEYGNSDYGYIIGEANGLSGTSTLVPGQSITIPALTTSSNTANTFKPYDPGSIIGSTTPNLPAAPPPPSSAGCNVLGEIVVAAVVAVVAYYLGPVAAEETGSYLLGGAITGAAASAAGQLAGDAVGVQTGFDWGQVAEGAVGGAIGGSLSQEFSTPGNTFYSATTANNISIGGNALIGGASYVGSYETAKVTGEAAHFSWAGLVANAAGSVVAGELGPTKAQTQSGDQSGAFLARVGANAAQDVVTRETSVALGDNHVQSWQQVGVDVFGNALGNAAIAGINAYKTNQLPAVNEPGTTPIVVTPSSALAVNDIPQTIAPVGPVGYTVQPGDTLSGYAGTSDPATIGMLMYLNGLSSSTLQPGQQLISGNLSDYSPDQIAQFQQSGQAALNNDNAVIAARGSQDNIDDVPLFQPSGGSGTSSEQVYTAAPSPYANWSLATAGTGVGEVDEFGYPLQGASHYSLGTTFGNIVGSDESLWSKTEQLADLVFYAPADQAQLIAADEAGQAAAEAPYAHLDMLERSGAAGTSYGVATLFGASDATAYNIAQTANAAAPWLLLGSAYGASLQGGGGVPGTTPPGTWTPVNESMSDFSRAYQEQITGQTGQAYVVDGVKFDGVTDTSYLDAKGLYTNFVNGSGEFEPWWQGSGDFIDQAQRQLNVANGYPIEWHFAEEGAANATQSLFNQNGINGIQVIHTPFVQK